MLHSRTDPPPALLREVLALAPQFRGLRWRALPGGQSNRVWRLGDWVVKLYDPAAASPLFPNDPMAEARALRRLAGHGIAPELRAEGTGWLAYAHVPGPQWSGDPAPVAALFQRLHRMPPDGFRHVASGSRALAEQTAAILRGCSGVVPMPPDAGVSPALPVLIHGDAVAGNLVAGPEGLVLIDWQCPASGDAAEDVAAFLSPAMQRVYRGRPLTAAEESAFLAACPPRLADRYRALAPAFHARMAAHCLWKAERGVRVYAEALRLELAALAG